MRASIASTCGVPEHRAGHRQSNRRRIRIRHQLRRRDHPRRRRQRYHSRQPRRRHPRWRCLAQRPHLGATRPRPTSGPTGPEIASFDGLTTQNVWTVGQYPASWQQLDNHGNGTGLTKSLAELMRTGIGQSGPARGGAGNSHRHDPCRQRDPLHDRDIAVFRTSGRTTRSKHVANGQIGDADGDGFITVAHTPVVGAGGGAAAAALREFRWRRQDPQL